MHIVIIFINIGSYHAARLQATSEKCQKLNWQFTAIQVTDDTLEHSWGDFGSNLKFPIKTLLTTKFSNTTKKDTFSSVACRALKNCLSEIKPDTVFIPGWSFAIARTALKWCQHNRVIPILMSDSNEYDAPRVWWKELYKTWIVSKYKAGLVGGLSSKQYLMKLGMKSEAIFSGYDVVDNDFFHPKNTKNLPRNHQKPYFLAVNRFVPKKNLLFLLSAYAEYHRKSDARSWDLVLCGDGELASQIKKKINELNLQDAVHLPGFLTPQELLPYFAHGSCFIHASIQEQWGLVINEAMAAGLPVLVSNRCGCYPDLILENNNGFGFDPENSTQLSNLMLKVSSSEFDLKSMGQAALKQIQKFSPEHFSQSFVQAVQYSLKIS